MSPAPASTGGPELGCTVTVDVPLFPELVAVIVAVPADTPTTEPWLLTVATLVALLAKLIAAPSTGLPFASLAVATSCTIPYAGIVAVVGVTSTDATATVVTVTADVPLLPSLVAVIVTGPPPAFPFTRPLEFTVAIVVSAEAHVTVRSVSGLPSASFGVAVSCTVAPTCTLADVGVTVTDETATYVWHAGVPVSVNVCPATGTNCQE